MFLGGLFFSLNAELRGQTCDDPSTLILSSGTGSSCGTNPLTVENNEFGGGAISVTLSTNGYGTLDQDIIDITPFSFTYTPAIADAGSTVIITVTANNPDQECDVLVFDYLLDVNNIPETPVVSDNGPLCEGETLNLFTATETEGIYNWSGPDGFTSTLQNPTITNVTSAASGTYQVTVTVNGCTSEAGSTEVTVNAVPEAPEAGSNGPLCEGSTLELTAGDVPGGSYYWSGPGGFTSTLQNPTITNVTGAASGTYLVTVTVSGCTSDAGSASVEINPLPSPVTGSNYTMAGSSTILTSSPAGGFWSSTVPTVAEINSSSGEARGMATGLTVITYTLPTGCSVAMTFNVLPSAWEFDSESFTHRSLITASVIIEGTEAESGFLAAFAGNECRGIAESVYNSLYGNYIFELNCFSNTETGDVLVFRYFNTAENREFNLDRSVDFIAGVSTGSASAPFRINTGTDYSLSLSTGWNWFSLNTTLDNMTPRFILSSQNTPGDYIKNQTVSSTYYEGLGWFGSLETLDPAELYKIRLENNSMIRFSGRQVDAEATPISVASGWNWIGYPPRQSMPVNSALESLIPADLDYIKDQSTSSTYYSEFGLWFGNMDDMEPGKGYMLRVANPGTLIYPATGSKGNQIVSGTEQTGEFNPHPYEYNGEVNVRIMQNDIPKGSENDTLYAYVDDELRGLKPGLLFPDGTYYFSLMIYSNILQGEIVTFKYYNSDTQKLYTCNETVIFVSDMRLGSGRDPLIFNANVPTSVHENTINDPGLSVYPNPSDNYFNIEYTLTEPADVRITVYDTYGRIIRTLTDQKHEPGNYLNKWNSDLPPEGMYFIKLENGKRQKIRKVILLK